MTGKSGVRTPGGGSGIPSELSLWGRQVVRKVEEQWFYPEGIDIDPANNMAEVMFTIDRNGNLTGEPAIVKEANDSRVGQSGLEAIKAAAPFPPLPETYTGAQLQIIYSFTMEQL